MNHVSISAETLARLRGAELSRISHALRTPITSIVGFADAILSDPTIAREEKEEFAKIIKAEGERLSKFVDELLYASFAAKEAPQRRHWDIGPVVSAAFHDVSLAAASRSITLRYEMGSACSGLSVEKEFVIRILGNILINAVWHAPEETEITVGGEASSTELVLTIQSLRKHEGRNADADAIGLARTRYVLGLQGGSLEVAEVRSKETKVTMRLPLKS